ncbi:MAG: T9SS type A sorting domain-containing protein [Flavobacteriaceae bacterium]
MKKLLLFLGVISLNFVGFSQANNYQNGDTVNDFTVTDTEGNVHNLYDITASGKYVFVDFFFDTCPPCQQTQPYYNELHDKYGCNQGEIFVISINNGTDTNAEVIAFENTYGGPFEHAPAVGIEGGCAAVDNDFGVNAYPTYCLIGPDNKMINRDIWPIADVTTYEDAFPAEFNPDPMSCTPLSIGDTAKDASFVLYPNPVKPSENIGITLREAMASEVSVYNVLGKLVFSKNYDSKRISIQHNLPTGTYFVSVQTKNGVSNRSLIVK